MSICPQIKSTLRRTVNDIVKSAEDSGNEYGFLVRKGFKPSRIQKGTTSSLEMGGVSWPWGKPIGAIHTHMPRVDLAKLSKRVGLTPREVEEGLLTISSEDLLAGHVNDLDFVCSVAPMSGRKQIDCAKIPNIDRGFIISEGVEMEWAYKKKDYEGVFRHRLNIRDHYLDRGGCSEEWD